MGFSLLVGYRLVTPTSALVNVLSRYLKCGINYFHPPVLLKRGIEHNVYIAKQVPKKIPLQKCNIELSYYASFSVRLTRRKKLYLYNNNLLKCY